MLVNRPPVFIALSVSLVLLLPPPTAFASSASAARLMDTFNAAGRNGDNAAGAVGRSTSASGGGTSSSGGSLPPGTIHSSHSGGYISYGTNGSYTHTVNGITNTYHPPSRSDNPLTVDWDAFKAQRERKLADQAEQTRLQKQADDQKALERRQAVEQTRAQKQASGEKRAADEARPKKATDDRHALEQKRLDDEVRQANAREDRKVVFQQQAAELTKKADSNPLTADWKSIQAQRKMDSSGRAKHNLQPDPDATGPHTTFKDRPGNVKGYAEWTPNEKNPTRFDLKKRVDLQGAPHYNKVTEKDVPTPHVTGPGIPGRVRPATRSEIPQFVRR